MRLKDEITPQLEAIRETLGDTKDDIRELTKNMRNLNINMLALGFFGKLLQTTFSALLNPAASLVGIFDLWNIALQMLFLPLMIELMPLMMNFTNWIMNLDPVTQKTIGAIVLLMMSIGFLLSTMAFWTIGIKNFLTEFPKVTSALKELTAMKTIGIGIALVGLISFGFELDQFLKDLKAKVAIEVIYADLSGLAGSLSTILLGMNMFKPSPILGTLALVSIGAQIIFSNMAGEKTLSQKLYDVLYAGFAGFVVAGPPGAIIAVSAAVVLDFVISNEAWQKLKQDLSDLWATMKAWWKHITTGESAFVDTTKYPNMGKKPVTPDSFQPTLTQNDLNAISGKGVSYATTSSQQSTVYNFNIQKAYGDRELENNIKQCMSQVSRDSSINQVSRSSSAKIFGVTG